MQESTQHTAEMPKPALEMVSSATSNQVSAFRFLRLQMGNTTVSSKPWFRELMPSGLARVLLFVVVF